MSKSKRASTANEYYSNFLYGDMYNRNPAGNRFHIIQRMYQRILTELATNRFKWSGMPDSIDVRFLELSLFRNALSVFYFDKGYDKHFALRAAPSGFLNMIDNPTAFTVIGNNFVGKTIKASDCVPIWANYLRVPDLDIVSIYATKLAETDVTIEINAKNARQSKFIIASEDQRLSMVNINRQIDEGQNGIQVKGALQDLGFVQAVDLGINPDTIEKLHILRTRLWNECMGLLGIENANQDKKERLVAAEVTANDDQTSMMRYVNLNARRIAAEEIKEKFKLDVSVEYYTDEDREPVIPEFGNV